MRLAPPESRTLDLLSRFDSVARRSASAETAEGTELLLAIFNKRALSTFGALLLTIDRRAAFLDGRAPGVDQFQLSLFPDEGDGGISMRIGMSADRERSWLRRLRALAAPAAALESKVARLCALIARTSEPVIVFTEFRDSLSIIERALSSVAAVTVAHGALAPRLFADALAAFQSGRARVLVATDAASQGLNLQQRCRWVIHFDRPWNPVRLEQRAGRVDRLGQARDVHVTELMASHDREFELAARVERRTQAAATSEWLRPCDRWMRRAQAAARVLDARRRLGALWRGPAIARPLATSRTASASGVPRASVKVQRECHEQRGTPGGDVVRLYRTDIIDRDGRVRESVLWRNGRSPVAARLTRLARLEGERALRRSAVARALGARHRAELTQLTLPGAGAQVHGCTGAQVHGCAGEQVRGREPEENEPLLFALTQGLIAVELG